LRFCIVGAIGFLIDAGVLQLLTAEYGVGLLVGRVFSYVVAATATWSLHRRFTFADVVANVRGKGPGTPASLADEWTRFVVANALGAAVNYGAYAVCILAGALFRSYPALAVAVGSVIGLSFNYVASKRFVFRDAPGR
jgi:putative flippase GtrA